LASSRRRVTLDRVTTSADKVEQLRELDDEVIVVHSVERMVLQIVLVERLLERESGKFLPFSPDARSHVCTHVVLLDNLDEAREVELGEEREVVHVGNECSDFILQLPEPLFHLIQAHAGIASVFIIVVITPSIVIPVVTYVSLHVSGSSVRAILVTFFVLIVVVNASDKLDHLLLERHDPPEQLIRLVPLEALALLQLLVERLEELLLGRVGPGQVGLDLLLERPVRDVLVRPLRVERVLRSVESPSMGRQRGDTHFDTSAELHVDECLGE